MLKMRTAMVCGRECTAPEGDYYVKCSFDSNHVILRSRMPYHIINCVKQHPGHNKVQCPYDATEYIEREEFTSHLLTCEFRRSICSEKFETADLKAKGNLCNIKQTPFFHDSLPEPDEDWGAESESGTTTTHQELQSHDSEDFLQEEIPPVGRGIKIKKRVPQKGMGRGELLNHILTYYQKPQYVNTSDSRLRSGKEDHLRDNAVKDQFED